MDEEAAKADMTSLGVVEDKLSAGSAAHACVQQNSDGAGSADWRDKAARRSASASDGAPMISVIIPVRDNPDGIRQMLSCLAAQTLSRDQFEVIIADDGSRPALAPSVLSSDCQVRLLTRPPQTSYAARNAAARKARGAVLAFSDSDCLPRPSWLERGIEALADADVVAGEVTFMAPGRPNIWSLLTIDLFLDQEQNVRLSRGVTANLVVRRELFEQLGGFDESLPSGGDYEFVERAVERGARLRHAPGAVVAHPTIDNGRAFLRKIWNTNYWSGARTARRGDEIRLDSAVFLMPIVGVVVARRDAFRPALCLSAARLEAAKVRCGFRDQLRAVAALYFVVCYVAGAGRISGWLKGWRLARAGAGPSYGARLGRQAPELRGS